MLLYQADDLHVFGWLPDGARRRQSVGLAARARARGRWRHASVSLSWPRRDLRLGRGLLHFEAQTFLSKGAKRTEPRDRLTVKAFFRVKVGFGGRR